MKNKLKVFAICLISLVISSLIMNNVFVGNSPMIRPNIAENFSQKIKTILSRSKDLIAGLEPFKFNARVTQNGGNYTNIAPDQKFEDADSFMDSFNTAPKKVEYNFIATTGQKVNMFLPEGVEPPPQSMVDLLK